MGRELRFGFVLTPAEKCALVRLSEAEGGLSQAATVRRLIRKEARRRGLWRVPKTDGTTSVPPEGYTDDEIDRLYEEHTRRLDGKPR